MKKSENKHDHKGTKCLKLIIFSILMLAPFIAVGTTCMTTYWNQTIEMPTQELQETPSYETNEVNTIDDLVVGNIYNFTLHANYVDTTIYYFNATKVYNSKNEYYNLDLDVRNYNTSYFNLQESSNAFRFGSNSYNMQINIANNKQSVEGYTFQFVYYSGMNPNYISQVSKATWFPNVTYEIVETTSTDLNIFYYAVDQIEQQEIFNWTTNTALYTPIKATTDNLQIQTNVIAILLTYWLLITAIYIIVDIVIEMFIFITHWANDRL